MTTLLFEPAEAIAPVADSTCSDAAAANAHGGAPALAVLASLPLRERVAVLKQAAVDVFDAVMAPVIDWGDDPDVVLDVVTVDDELVALQAERRALVEVTVDIVEMGRSLEASTRVLADQHTRVMSHHDVLDLDQLERRLSSPGTVLAGEFACDDSSPILDISAAASAQWAELGSTLRARRPHLLALAGRGHVRSRACLVIAQELDHLDPADVSHVEAEFLGSTGIHGSEASIRQKLRTILAHHGLSKPVDARSNDAEVRLAFTEMPHQPTLTELFVVMPAEDAWKLNTAVDDRAAGLKAEWAAAHVPDDEGYSLRRARVDALLDLALGHVRCRPDVKITVPITLTRPVARDSITMHGPHGRLRGATPPQRAREASWALCGANGSPPVSGSIPAGVGTVSEGAARPSLPARVDASRPEVENGWMVADLDVPGLGRVPAATLNALGGTLGASVHTALADTTTGVTAWTATTTYRPGAGIRRFVETRDQHCRFPGCMRPAPTCDVDHVVAHAQGGATSADNLQLLCRHHHRTKTHGAWAVAMTSHGVCVWQSPVGDWFRTHPGDSTAYRTSAEAALALIS